MIAIIVGGKMSRLVYKSNNIEANLKDIKLLLEDYNEKIKTFKSELEQIINSNIWNGNDASNYQKLLLEKYLISSENNRDLISNYITYMDDVNKSFILLENDLKTRKIGEYDE